MTASDIAAPLAAAGTVPAYAPTEQTRGELARESALSGKVIKDQEISID